MHRTPDHASRRGFIADVGRLASVMAAASCVPAAAAMQSAGAAAPAGEWDLGWIKTIEHATDRAVFDWPTLGDAGDSIVLQIAERYLDNCAAAYGSRAYEACVVLNIRTTAVPAALSDAMWERYTLGTEYNAKDPVTQQPATRNPFLHRAPSPAPGIVMPTLADLMQRGALVLVCDFALGHLSKRIASRVGRSADEVHKDLRDGFVPGAFAVPSGIFGLARSQNSGCAFVRM
jgi:hypothetical protein